MAGFDKDLVIPREMLNEFKVSIRVIDKRHWQGIWPIDLRIRKVFEQRFPELFKNKYFQENYDMAIVYKGKNLKKDIAKFGFDAIETKVYERIFLRGIPVPWDLLRKLNIDHKKFDVMFTPRM
jgi:hypothetical protein